MSLSEIKRFSLALQNIHQNSSHYISIKNGQYIKTDDKKDKTLNTKKIADLAERFFNDINKNVFSATYEERLDHLKNLNSALNDYRCRLYKSKKWYEKIADFFGIRSPIERRIIKVLDQIEDKRFIINFKIRKIAHHGNEVLKNLKRDEESGYMKLKHFYLGVLDSISMQIPALDAINANAALYWYIEKLKEFKNETIPNPSYGLRHTTKLDAYIKELDFAFKNHCLIESYLNLQKAVNRYKGTGQEVSKTQRTEHHYFKKEAIFRILEKIQKLAPGGYVLISGGYLHLKRGAKGHAVMYCIEKTKKNNFVFKVINTGEGSNFDEEIVGVDDFKQQMRITLNNISQAPYKRRLMVKDVEYIVAKKDLTFQFFSNLFDKGLDKNSKGMKNIYEYLENFFGKKLASQAGRRHKAQRKGSCSHKCISATSKVFLPLKVCLDFKAWLTDKEIKSFKTYNQNAHFDFEAGLEKKILQEAQTLLTKRRQKAANAA